MLAAASPGATVAAAKPQRVKRWSDALGRKGDASRAMMFSPVANSHGSEAALDATFCLLMLRALNEIAVSK